MEQYIYEEFLEELSIGIEIHFLYKMKNKFEKSETTRIYAKLSGKQRQDQYCKYF